MKSLLLACLAAVPLQGALTVSAAAADPILTTGHSRDDVGFKLDPVPPPAVDDAATKAVIRVIGGTMDPNSRGGLAALTDGKLPASDDAPGENFFFSQGTERGRLLIDLGKTTDIKAVGTYSWHRGGRGPQQYDLYAADSGGIGFKLEPGATDDPAKAGWTLIQKVDTSAKGGGQHAVEISGKGKGTLGKFRYLLLEARPNQDESGFGQTFFSEIDVIDAAAPDVTRVKVERLLDTYRTTDGKYTFVVDSTQSPDLRE